MRSGCNTQHWRARAAATRLVGPTVRLRRHRRLHLRPSLPLPLPPSRLGHIAQKGPLPLDQTQLPLRRLPRQLGNTAQRGWSRATLPDHPHQARAQRHAAGATAGVEQTVRLAQVQRRTSCARTTRRCGNGSSSSSSSDLQAHVQAAPAELARPRPAARRKLRRRPTRRRASGSRKLAAARCSISGRSDDRRRAPARCVALRTIQIPIPVPTKSHHAPPPGTRPRHPRPGPGSSRQRAAGRMSSAAAHGSARSFVIQPRQWRPRSTNSHRVSATVSLSESVSTIATHTVLHSRRFLHIG